MTKPWIKPTQSRATLSIDRYAIWPTGVIQNTITKNASPNIDALGCSRRRA